LRSIRSVRIEFEDGSIEEHILPDSAQGFYRERYTFQERLADSKEMCKLWIHEIHWTMKEHDGTGNTEENKLSIDGEAG
jgi:hypothetical protein